MNAGETYPKVYLYRQIVQAKLFIDGHFADPITLEAIAEEAYFSKFHFIRLFKSIYGKTPHQYLIAVRIERAKTFLQKGMSVTETCYAVGFDSASTFTGLFRKVTRLSPSAYQQQFMKRREQIRNAPLEFIPNCFAEQKGWTQEKQF